MHNFTFFIAVIAILVIAVVFITYRGLQLNNDQYDRLKAVVMKWPAIITFLGVIIATFPGISYGAETVTVVAAIGAFLAECLNVSDKSFNGGAEILPNDTPLPDDYDDALRPTEDGDLDE